MSTGDLSAARARYAREISARLRERGEDDPRVEAAFAAVPRERFLTPPPWRIFAPGGFMDAETEDPAKLYADVLVVLDRKLGINNGQPSLHAAWLSAVAPQTGERVVQIGIGAGYYTAIIAELVGEGGRVDAYEIEPRLAAIARDNLRGAPQIAVHAASGVGGELPAADVVYVSASAAAPDAAWLRCLDEGGRLVFPWQAEPHVGTTAMLTRLRSGFQVRLLMEVSFVGCVGAGAREKRTRGLPSRAIRETGSAWLTAEQPPDGSATAIYEDVWFSLRGL